MFDTTDFLSDPIPGNIQAGMESMDILIFKSMF